jgi:hypothetical protein
MLKSLALGLLTMSAACTSVALAHDNHNIKFHDQSVTFCHKNCDNRNYQPPGNTDPSPAAAPEIDPAGAMAALTLLAGGLAVVRGRRGSRAS